MYVFIILCLFSQSVFALKSLTRISDVNSPIITYNDTVALLDGKLFFLASGNHLWSSEGTANTTHELQFNDKPVLVFGNKGGLNSINNKIVYINLADRTLWFTDESGFQQLSNVEVYRPGAPVLIEKIGNYLVAKDVNNNKLVISDGHFATTLDLGVIENINIASSVCVIDHDHIAIVQDAEHIYSINNNSVSILSTDIFTNKETSNFKLKVSNNGECFYQYDVQVEERLITDIFKLSDNNDIGLIEADEENIIGWSHLVEFNNEILLFPIYSSHTGYKYLHKLAFDSLSTQKIETIRTSGSFIGMYASKNFFYFHIDEWFGGVRPAVSYFYSIYNQDLNEIEISNGFIPEIISTSSEDISWNDDEIDYIKLFSKEGDSHSISAAEISIKSIIADDKSTYVFGYDRSSPFYHRTRGVYKISNNVPISKQITGLWVDNNWASQGMSVHTGIRADRSEYVFVSFYIYKDGESFWVAGNRDISFGESTILIDLYEFKGQSFLSNTTGQNYLRVPFGNVKIEMTGCNNLQAEINVVDEDTVSLEMQRIDDVTYSNYCSE